MQLESPVNDTRALLGEGPVWHQGVLYWVDIHGRAVLVHDPATRTDRAIPLNEMPGCVWPCTDGRLICGLQSGFAFLDPASGALEPITDPEAGNDTTRFNDGKGDPHGNFWAGTLDLAEVEPLGALYRLDPRGAVRRCRDNITVSNGMAWTADGRTLFYIDTPTRKVVGFDCNPQTGELTAPRTVVEFGEDEGFPDGMTIDTEGKLWIALWQGWSVVRCDPEDGATLERIELPVEKVTSCFFGGEARDRLYITTARTGLSDEALAAQPHAGGLFVARPGASGHPTVPYAVVV